MITKIKKIINKIKFPLLAFVLTIAILLFVFMSNGAVNGEFRPLTSDATEQYYVLFNYLKDVFDGAKSALFTTSVSGGVGLLETFCYYLISPFNLLLLFFSKNQTENVMLSIIILKMATASLTMYYYLYKNTKISNIYQVLFGVLYALSSFSIMYYFHIMWLDNLYLFPLLIMGLDKLIEDKKPALYFISLFMMIMTNFHIAFSSCVISVLYFLLKEYNRNNYFKDFKGSLKNMISFAVVSILSALSAVIVLLPSIMQAFNNGRIKMLNTKLFNKTYIFDGLFFQTNNIKEVLNGNIPFIYSGLLVLILAILYLFNKKVNFKEKRIYITIISFLLISFFFLPFEFLLNGLIITICFRYRYTFIFSFFLIIMGAKNLEKIEYNKKSEFLIAGVIFLMFIMFNNLLNINVDVLNMILSSSLGLLFLLLIYTLTSKEYKEKTKLINMMIIFLTMAEISTSTMLGFNKKLGNKVDTYQEVSKNINEVVEYISQKDKTFYKIQGDSKYGSLPGLLYNHNSMSIFLSSTSNLLRFTNNNTNNILSNAYSYEYNLSNPLIDSMLGIRYIEHPMAYDYKMFNKFERVKKIVDKEDKKYDEYVFENNNALPIGYLINEDTKLNTYDNINKVIDNTNLLNKVVFNNKETLYKNKKIDIIDNKKFEIIKGKENVVYLNFSAFLSKIELRHYFIISVNDQDVAIVKCSSLITARIPLFGQEGTANKIKIRSYTAMYQDELYIEDNFTFDINEINAYTFDNESFNKSAELKKEESMYDVKVDKETITGKINVKEDDSTLMFVMPYDKNFNVYVDGNKVDTIKLIDNTFLGIKIDKGTHDIKIKYYPRYLNLSIIISAISLIITFIYLKFIKQINDFIYNIYSKYEEIIIYLIVGVITTIINIVLYNIFRTMNINYMLSNFISWIITIIAAFIMNKVMVFKTKGNIKKEAIEFTKFRLLSLVMESIMMLVGVSYLKFNDKILKVIVSVIVIVLNYIFSKLYIFRG